MRKFETPHTLLSALTAAHMTLTVSGEKLGIDAPKGALTDEFRQAIRQHKAELLARLRTNETPRRADKISNVSIMNPGVPTIAMEHTVPDGTYRFTNPQTGQYFVSSLYKCPRCQSSHWGPSIADPNVWHCLTCAAQEPEG